MNLPQESLDNFQSLGYRTFQVGEYDVVDIGPFLKQLPDNKKLSYYERRFDRDGYTLQVASPPHSRQLIRQLKRVSDSWLSRPGRRELGFVMGHFDAHFLNQCQVFSLVDPAGRIVAFANFLPTLHRSDEVAMDMGRYLTDAQNGSFEVLVIKILRELGNRGTKRMSFGLSALAGLDALPKKRLEERLLGPVSRVEAIYPFKSLRRFKAKFNPTAQPGYLAYKGLPPDIIKVGLAFNALSRSKSG